MEGKNNTTNETTDESPSPGSPTLGDGVPNPAEFSANDQLSDNYLDNWASDDDDDDSDPFDCGEDGIPTAAREEAYARTIEEEEAYSTSIRIMQATWQEEMDTKYGIH